MKPTVYALGHADAELDRLQRQHRFLEPTTRRFFVDAGLRPGMRVLDVGSGAGDVAFLAADLVGPTGTVVGSDRVPAAVRAATDRARALGLDTVTFREGDPGELTFEDRFDAVVGRYVLLFQAEPASLLRSVARHLRPGGVVAFHEPTWDSVGSVPPVPLYDQSRRWIQDAFAGSQTPDVGFAPVVYRAFMDAGLAHPTMRLQTHVTGGADAADWIRAVADLVISLLPAIARLGIATAADVDAPTLAQRMLDQVVATESVLTGRTEIGAWARI